MVSPRRQRSFRLTSHQMIPVRESIPPLNAAPAWKAIVFGAMAGGMGCGIRGQYGHETSEMIAGLALGLVLTLLFCPRIDAQTIARAVAW